MRRNEIQAVGRLAADVLAAGGSLISQTHEGIASRPFGILGDAAAPVRLIHDAVSTSVYAGMRGGVRAAAMGASRLAALRAPDSVPSLGDGARGSLALAILNGFYGDLLADQNSELALGMSVRRGHSDVELDSPSLCAAFPDATSRIVVFAHGLCETENAWRLTARAERGLQSPEGTPRRTYGERLQDALSFTPVYLRYNTGLRVSENGRALAALLDELIDGWPCPVEELVLVGHSMGGLVARSACHYGERDDLRFTGSVRHVFCLGTPHLGADLEKGVNALAWALQRLPETRALSRLLNARSTGIKDLRFGALAEEDWHGHEPDEFLRDRCQEVPFLPDAHYYFIGATLYDGPLGQLLGDLLVRSPSASGRGNGKGRRIPFEVDNGLELTGLTHFDLLNHPAVYEQLHRWLARTPPRPRALLTA